MLRFRDMELDFDLLDAGHAEIYEEALRILQGGEGKPGKGAALSEMIRWECRKVFSFFDCLFGEGFHAELFGERTNLSDCMAALEEFIEIVNTQREALSQRVARLENAQAAGGAPAARKAMGTRA